MSRRLKANSVFDADGKPTSISLKPIFTSVWNNSSFCETFIGTASAWLPSRKSTLHQRGACGEDAVGPLAVGQLRPAGTDDIFLTDLFAWSFGFLIIAVRR